VASGSSELEARSLMLGRQTQVYECIEASSIGADGRIWNLRRGDRVAAKHPALTANPSLFKAVDSGHPTKIQSAPTEQPEQKPVQMVRARRNLRIEGILVGGSFWTRGLTTINEGDELRADLPSSPGIRRTSRKSNA
jgi:hypothetical protein